MTRTTTDEHQQLNRQQTIFLVGGLTSILAIVGWLVGGVDLMLTTVCSVLSLVVIAPYISPFMVLHMHKAERLTAADSPSLTALVNDLTLSAKLSHTPKIYYIPSQSINAFTVGLKHNAAIAISDGLLRRMNRRELNAILAHEIGHIKNQDMRIMAIADVINQLIRIMSVIGLLLLLFSLPLSLFTEYAIPWFAIILLTVLPSITTVMKMKLSRTREFEADRTAVELSQDPHALISALKRLEYREWRWLTQLFWFPNETIEPSQLRSHPESDERIARLETQAREMNSTNQAIKTLGLDRIMSRHVWELNKRSLSNNKQPENN